LQPNQRDVFHENRSFWPRKERSGNGKKEDRRISTALVMGPSERYNCGFKRKGEKGVLSFPDCAKVGPSKNHEGKIPEDNAGNQKASRKEGLGLLSKAAGKGIEKVSTGIPPLSGSAEENRRGYTH